MSDKPEGSYLPAGQWLKLAAALYLLNFVLTFHNVWPSPWITTRHELSVEIAALLVGLFALVKLRGRVSNRALSLLAILLTLMCIGRYAEVTAPALYGRRINLYWDAQHLPGVAAMLIEAAPVWLVALLALALLTLLVAVYVVLRWALRQVGNTLHYRGPGYTLAGVGGLMVLAYVLEYSPLPVRVWQWFSLPVSTTYWRQAAFMVDAASNAGSLASLPAPVSLAEPQLQRVAGSDALVMFVESYGATAYDNPAVATRVAPIREAFANAVRESGRHAASAFVESPTFGGGSWLAHMSFMTGLDVRDQGTYNLLLTQRRDTLPMRFAASDYRIVALMPGLKSAWPEGAFYDLETVYGERALAYPGPDFGWWRIPDQFSLAKFAALELDRPERRPVFLFFPTINTHMPFKPTPPYQADWRRLLTDSPFDEAAATRALTHLPEWTDLQPAYADALVYTFEYLSGFVHERAGDDFVLILLGDHQPPASVSGQDARWDVPVHVIASREDIVATLIDAGFAAGMTPGDASLGRMHMLTPLLLEAFSNPATATRTSGR
jgi:hypothetical protein